MAKFYAFLIIAVAAFIAGSAVVHQRPQNYVRILGMYSFLRQKMADAGILSGFRDNSQKKILTNQERTVVSPPTTGTDGEELPKPTVAQHSAEAIYQAEQIVIQELLDGDTQRKEQQEYDGEEDEEEEYDGEEEDEEEEEEEDEEEEEEEDIAEEEEEIEEEPHEEEEHHEIQEEEEEEEEAFLENEEEEESLTENQEESAVHVWFHNNLKRAIEIFWVDPESGEKYPATPDGNKIVRPDERVAVQTSVGHIFHAYHEGELSSSSDPIKQFQIEPHHKEAVLDFEAADL
eukprot:CAMPEP_0172425710 /NCGR_PEP_ID=MMETSP1064-20121228/33586_1 /TAXON_ID=202472 /ORGANISM="Aulacoseira subarctica , Strain CCAP 1002/5" /LENGTH=288 /DNA_ID=CAMNT_0013168827 /DNA_START=117 /DNA_END=983 /DNA_ORIENTATION=-